jgi:hypothetical protein
MPNIVHPVADVSPDIPGAVRANSEAADSSGHERQPVFGQSVADANVDVESTKLSLA